MPDGAAAPCVALNADAVLLVTAMALPVSVPLTVLLTGPVVPPVAVNVCAPCAPMAPEVAIETVTEQVLAGLTRQVLADSEYGALMPVKLSVTAVLPLFVYVTVPEGA